MRIKEVRDAAEYMNTHSGGTEVIANPELDGTEAALTGLQVGSTKYKVEAGGDTGSAFSLNTIPEIPEGEKSVGIEDEKDIALLEKLYTDVLTNQTFPMFYKETFVEGEGDVEFATIESYICAPMFSDNGPFTISCTELAPSFHLDGPFALNGVSILVTVFMREAEGTWTYNRDYIEVS